MNAVVRAFLFEFFCIPLAKYGRGKFFLLRAGLIFGPGIWGVSLETLGSFVIVVVCVFFPLSIIPSLKLPINLPHLCIGLFFSNLFNFDRNAYAIIS